MINTDLFFIIIMFSPRVAPLKIISKNIYNYPEKSNYVRIHFLLIEDAFYVRVGRLSYTIFASS